MRLGISYPVFDGVELFEYTLRSVRGEAAHLSAVYQTTSYFGRPAGGHLVPTLERLRAAGLLDEVVEYRQDPRLRPQENETQVRALGQRLSIAAGCTHHMASDVDEMYVAEQLAAAKRLFVDGGYDSSCVWMENHFKRPGWVITPSQKSRMPFIHILPAEYVFDQAWPFPADPTRRAVPAENCRMFERDEVVCHHMSYVRKDIREKVENNNNWINGWHRGGTEEFIAWFDRYGLGDRLIVPPDFLSRRTVEVPNIFGIVI